MRTSVLPLVGGLLAVASASVLPIIKREPDDTTTTGASNRLVPYDLLHSRSSLGLGKRATDGQYTSMDPCQQAQLVWGSPSASGNVMVANMTLHATENQPLVSLEQFNDLTSSVDCNDDDGKLGVVFKDAASYKYALNKWSYINDDANAKFVVIANHQGCGAESERQTYKVNKVLNDDNALSVTFEATPTDFDQSAAGYDLTFGHTTLPANNTAPLVRRLCVTDCSGTDSGTMPVNIGTPKKSTQIVNTGGFNVDCTNCYVAGSVKVTGTVSVNFLTLSVKALTLSVNPSAMTAALEVTSTVSASANIKDHTFELVPDIAVPGAGFSIAKIFDLGLTTGLSVGYSVDADASVSFVTGLDATVPDSVNFQVDLVNLAKSSATGFQQTKFTPVLDITNGQATVTGTVFMTPKLVFEASVLKIGKAEIGFDLGLPTITMDATAEMVAAGGVCGDAKTTKGVEFNVDGMIDINFVLDGSLLGLTSSYNKMLFQNTFYHYDKCIPIAGSAPVKASSTKHAVTTTNAVATGVHISTTSVKHTSSGGVGVSVTSKGDDAGPTTVKATGKKTSKGGSKPTGIVKSSAVETSKHAAGTSKPAAHSSVHSSVHSGTAKSTGVPISVESGYASSGAPTGTVKPTSASIPDTGYGSTSTAILKPTTSSIHSNGTSVHTGTTIKSTGVVTSVDTGYGNGASTSIVKPTLTTTSHADTGYGNGASTTSIATPATTTYPAAGGYGSEKAYAVRDVHERAVTLVPIVV